MKFIFNSNLTSKIKKVLSFSLMGFVFFSTSGTLMAQEEPNVVPLKKGTFICLNNFDPRCENPDRFPETFNIEEARQDEDSFVCLNNLSPGNCENPITILHRFPEGFDLQAARQDEDSFVCLNNLHPSCGNHPRFIRE